MSPEQRENAKNALAYFTALYYRQPEDTTTPDDILKSMLTESSLEVALANLLSGMTTIANMLALIGFRNSDILPGETLREIGEILTRGE
jgi:hypothetical protein